MKTPSLAVLLALTLSALTLNSLSRPAFADGKPLSIDQLRTLVTELNQTKKSDDEVAASLMRVTLAERLESEVVDTLAPLLPGPFSKEQLELLESLSAALPQSTALQPTLPPLDAAGQTDLLAKAKAYLARTASGTPRITAIKSIKRYQNGGKLAATYSGGGLSDAGTSTAQGSSPYIKLIDSDTAWAFFVDAAEQPAKEIDTTHWGSNGKVNPTLPPLFANTLFQEASQNGALHFVRWESVRTRRLAVFAYALNKKQSHYAINYCCFPVSNSTGSPTGGTATFQSESDWKPFKTSAPYHGEIFIDAETGAIRRTVTVADLKKFDYVHTESILLDYGLTVVGQNPVLVPSDSILDANITPNGESFAGGYSNRHMLITASYSAYKPAP